MSASLYSPTIQSVFDAIAHRNNQGKPAFPSPIDWRDQPMYFLMTDRFNNPLQAPRHHPYDDAYFQGFQGGNFAGIQQKLSYIKNLGFGCVCLSPVQKNLPFDSTSYHGYGIHDFLRIEPRFAINPEQADDELRTLVDAAHAAGLYVIFEIVLNHSGDVFAYADESNSADTAPAFAVQWRDANGIADPQQPDIAEISQPVTDGLIWPRELQHNHFFRRKGECAADDSSQSERDLGKFKQFRSELSELQTLLIRAHQYLIARFDVDGFKINSLRYLQGNFPQIFGNAIREYALSIGKKNFFTFGDVPDNTGRADNFIGRNTSTRSGDAGSLAGVDAALDYPLCKTLNPIIKGSRPPIDLVQLYVNRKQTEQLILSSHADATRFFVTFLDGPEIPERIRHTLEEPLPADDQVTLAIAALFSLPGIPCLYYGTEQGLRGGGSVSAVHEALWGICPDFPRAGLLYRQIQKIAALRQKIPALRYGRLYFRPISGNHLNFAVSNFTGGVLAWSRILNHQEIVIVANTHPTASSEFDVIIDSTLNPPGDRFQLLYTNKDQTAPPSPVIQLSQAIVNEAEGSTRQGPVNTLRINLQALEIQVLQRSLKGSSIASGLQILGNNR